MAAPSSQPPLLAPYGFNPEMTANCIQLVQYTRFGTLITTTLLGWDILTTLDREVRYVWRLRWCYTKLLFLFVRYGTFVLYLYQSLMIVSPIPSSVCRIVTTVNSVVSSVIMVAVTSMLMSRTWALYDRSRTMLYVLLVTYFVVFAPAIVIMIRPNAEFFSSLKDFEQAKQAASLEPDVAWLLGGCYVSGWPTGFVALFIALLVYETGLFAATAFKLWSVKSSATLIGCLFRDGTFYYVVMLATLIGGAVGSSNVANTASRAFVASGYFVGLKVVACSHMMLRLRGYLHTSEAYVEGVLRSIDDGITHDEISTEVRFADPRVLSEDKEEHELSTRHGSFEWDGKADWVRSEEGGNGLGDDVLPDGGSPRTTVLSSPPPSPPARSPSSPGPSRPPSLLSLDSRSPIGRRPSTVNSRRSTGAITVTRAGVWEELEIPLDDDGGDDMFDLRSPASPV